MEARIGTFSLRDHGGIEPQIVGGGTLKRHRN